MGGAYIVVRAATARDQAARLAVLRAVARETHMDAFLYFFFQELTLECVVLAGAVLFIFCGVSAPACLLALPAAAAAVAAGVRLHTATAENNHLKVLFIFCGVSAPACLLALPAAVVRLHTAAAENNHLKVLFIFCGVSALPAAETNQLKHIRGELAGWVAEYRGPLRAGGGAGARVVAERDLSDDERAQPQHREIVGTLSLCPHRSGGYVGWACAGGVARAWRRRGAGGALLGAAARHAAAAGLAALHALVSHLQPGARTLLHKHGWECRGTYHRPLLGAALSLPVALLALELPHA